MITGELKHHDQLAFQAAGVAVILLGHAESENPVLSSLVTRLTAAFPASHTELANTSRA